MEEGRQIVSDSSMFKRDTENNLYELENPKTESQDISSRHFALGPLDGRYSEIARRLSPYFSEYALIKNRVRVEVYWLKFLLKNVKGNDILDNFDMSNMIKILSIYRDFSENSFIEVKKIEAITNHDVKAVELYVAKRLKEMGMDSMGGKPRV